MNAGAGQESGVARGYLVPPGAGLSGGDPGIKASAASTGGSLTLIESRIQGGPPRHVHTHEDESFYVLDGSLTVHCGDDVFEADPRSFVFLPRRVPHHFETKAGQATVLLIVTPGGLEAYFREVNAAPDESSQHQIGARYGIHLV
jgi:mannose-6-phosphate isomerase-like protein (cupin superfamily)